MWARYCVIAIVSAMAFTLESWVLGPYSWMYGYGAGLETLPTHLALVRGNYLFSPWAPFVAGGLDRFAFWGNADPLNVEPWLLKLLPVWGANGLHRLLQYFIAILFASKVAQEHLRLEPERAALGGILFACFSYFTFGEMLALPALPLLLWALRRMSLLPRGAWLAFPFGLAFSSVTTFTHSDPYISVFVMLWTAFVLRDFSAQAWRTLALAMAGVCLGDAPQLFAVLANASLSHREGFPPETLDWSIDGLLYRQLRFDYFNQDPVAKPIAWFLPLPLLAMGAVAVAMSAIWRSTQQGRAYLRVFAIYLILSQRWLFVGLQNIVGEQLPWVRGIFMGRFFDLPASLLIAFQLALLYSLASDSLTKMRVARHALTVGVCILVAFMVIRPKIFLFYRNGVDGWGQANYEVKTLDQLSRSDTAPFRVASVLPLQPAYAYAQGLEAADGWANLYPKRYRQYWLRVLGPLLRNVPATKEIFDPQSGRPQDHYIFLGADLIHPTMGALPGEYPGRAMAEGFDVDQRFDLKLLGLLNVKYLLSELPLKSAALTVVHTPLVAPAAAYSRDWATGLLSPPSAPRSGGVPRLRNAGADLMEAIERKKRGKDVYVYRLQEFMPRFRFVDHVRYEASGAAVLDALAALPYTELQHLAIAETSTRSMPVEHFVSGTLVAPTMTSTGATLQVQCGANAFLVAAVTWSPYWRAEVDGRPVVPERVNHVQLGVRVPAGVTTIRLRYAPPYFPF
jgi:hypothetical protein